MKNKKVWKILLIVGLIPFIIPLIYGLISSIKGYSGLCFWMCEYYYGFEAFVDSIVISSYLFWPSYIIGFALIILSIIKIRKK